MKARWPLLLVLLYTGRGDAYVLTRTDAGNPVRWPMRCIVLAPDARGDISADSIDADTIDQVLERATTNWNNRIGSCSYMQLGVVPATRVLEAVSDGRPAVVFRADVWGRGDKMYDPSAIGVTTVWFVNRGDDPTDGQITDADIELNAVNWSFTTDPANAVARDMTHIADLENTLTHELGHVLGLAHTCWDHKTDVPPVDELGQPAPDCNDANLPAKVTMATMYPFVQERGVSMRVLSDDDVKGVCDAYPIADESPAACYGFIESTGCALGPSGPPGALLVVALLLLVLARTRRRRGML